MEQSGAWEEMIYEKKLEVKNLVTLPYPLKENRIVLYMSNAHCAQLKKIFSL